MKIVVVAGYSRSLLNFRGRLLETMVRAGHSVTACAPDFTPDVRNGLEIIGVTPREVPLERTGTNVASDIRTALHLRRLFRELEAEMVIGYTVKPVIYGSLAARSARVPRISSMITGLGYTFGMDSVRQRLVGMLTQALYKRALRANSVVFFQNPDDRQLFLSRGLIDEPDKAVLINGSGVDLEYFRRAPVKTDPPTFLLIARLLRDKGIREYVAAARLLKRKYPHARFHLVGPYDTNPAAISRSEVESWQSEGVIRYLGETDDVRPYIAEASVYVLPSYREGTPRTVLEAMSMGRPIITTDAPGCRETVIHGKNGYLVPVRQPEAIAAAMEHFILQPEIIETMGDESFKIASDKYDVNKVNSVIMSSLGL